MKYYNFSPNNFSTNQIIILRYVWQFSWIDLLSATSLKSTNINNVNNICVIQ